MKGGLARRAATLAAGVALALGLASATWAAPPMWVVKDKDSTIYLFGSMHVLEPGVKWRTTLFDAAYAKSSVVWFETDITAIADKAKMDAIVKQYGVDPDHPLSAKLGAEDRAALKARLEAAGLSQAGMDRLKPWMASLVLTVLPMRARGFDPKSGADVVMNHAASADRKPVRAFETPESQARYLADLPEPVQLQLLQDSLIQDSRTFADIKSVQTAWLSGDLQRLGPLLLADMKARRPDLYEVLIRGRNRAWADALATEMAGSGVEMVNVGALHMVGDDGLPALLAAKGFKVKRVQ
jgi:uncharacterized protein YbaP (TraB family)